MRAAALALAAPLLASCAFHARTDPPELLVAFGDAYTLECPVALEAGECPVAPREVRGGHLSATVGGVLETITNAAARFVGAGPPPPAPTIVVGPGCEI